MEDSSIEEIKSNLSLQEILQLKEKCSKKVFQNFLAKSYGQKNQTKDETGSVDDSFASDANTVDQLTNKEEDRSKKSAKRLINNNDREFEQVFGFKRNPNYRPTIKTSLLNPDKHGEVEKKVDPKDRPEERSTKYRPSKLRTIFHNKTKAEPERRDPRFDKNAGYFNQTRFDKSYAFLKEARQNDKQELKKRLNKVKDEGRRAEISKVIQRFENQEKSEKERAKKQELKEQLVEQKRKQLNSTQEKPVFVNKSELKKKALVEKFKELQDKNQLSKYLERKRKKNTAKERKLVFANEQE